jgi:hypothetical protein
MGKWLVPNATRNSHGLEGTKRPLTDCYFCLTNITGISSKSKHTVKYPDLPSAMRPGLHSEEFSVPKTLENLTFRDENSDSDKAHRQQGGEQFDCNLTFKANCSPSEPHL